MKKRKAIELIEKDATPQYELPLVRKVGGAWTELPAGRKVTSVGWRDEDLKAITNGHVYSKLHTHPVLEEDTEINNRNVLADPLRLKAAKMLGKQAVSDEEINSLTYSPSIPSKPDFVDFISDKNNQFMEIAQRDPVTGKVAGIYFFKKTKSTPFIPSFSESEKRDKSENIYASQLEQYDSNVVFDSKRKIDESQLKSNQEYLNRTVETLGLRARYVPTKGYTYKQGFGFVKDDKKNKDSLERKVTSIIAAGCLVSSMLFSLNNLTGNTIADLSVKTSSFIGAGLFMIALIAGFFWFKNRN